MGSKITNASAPSNKDGKDVLDVFLDAVDNPDAWRIITPDGIPLSKEELDIIVALSKGVTADMHFDPFAPSVDFFSGYVQYHPVSLNVTPPKRRFLPSAYEAKTIRRLVHAIRKGWIKKTPETSNDIDKDVYDLWAYMDDSTQLSSFSHIPAPKLKLPGHRESYRPPDEYLPGITTRERFEKSKALGKPIRKWISTKYSSLRHVPGYSFIINERFSRCLDLYMCPRTKKSRLNIDPETLLPKLPDLSDLRPYPNALGLNIIHTSHSSITCMDIDSTGHWILTGYSDGILTLSDTIIGRIYGKWKLSNDDRINCISWNPSSVFSSIASIACGSELMILDIFIGSSSQKKTISSLLSALETSSFWNNKIFESVIEKGHKLALTAISFVSKSTSTHEIKSLVWHKGGDYLASVAPKANNSAILFHQISRATFQFPFKKIDGIATNGKFHPTKPYFYLVTQKAIRCYDLSKQIVLKKIDLKGIQNISSVSLHPNGEHLLIGSLDSRVSWFDIELSTNAYKTLRYHKGGVRDLSFHQKYPLFASCGDDGHAHICYGKVFENSSLQNPLVVPVKILKPSHRNDENYTLNALVFHPTQPWIYLGASDGNIRMFLPTIY